MADYRIAYAITGDAASLVGAAGAARGALGSLEGAGKGALSALGGIAETAAKATVALGALGVGAAAAGLAAAVKDATAFQHEMSAVGAVAGATAEQMKQLHDLALQLGKDTSFSASESAKGVEELVKAGVSVKDILGGAAKASLDLAAAGGISVADAATIASNAMNAFSINGDKAAHIADVIAGAANASAIDVHEFGFSLEMAGAVANTIGFSFDDLAVAIAEMGNAGIKGSDAGTSLKQMFINLEPHTKQQISLFKELGLITADGSNKFFDAQGHIKSLAQVQQILQDATKNMTEEQRLSTLQTLFGTDAIRAAAVLSKAGAAGYDELAASIGKVTAAQVADTRLDNLSGSLEKLKGTVETAGITFGEHFLPPLKRLVDFINDELGRALPTIDRLGTVAGAAFDRLITRAIAAGPALAAMGTALVGLAGIAGRALGVVTQAATSAAFAVADFIGMDPGTFANVWAMWGEIVKTSIFIVEEAFGKLGDTMADLLGIVPDEGSTGWEVWGDVIYESLTIAGHAVGGLRDAFNTLMPVAISVGRVVVDNVVTTFRFLVDRVLPPVTSIIRQTAGAFLALQPALQRIGATLRDVLGDTLDWLAQTVWPPFLSIVEQTVGFFDQRIRPTLSTVAGLLRTTLGESVQWLATDVWPGLLRAVGVAWDFLSGTVAPALPGLARTIRDGLGGALQWVGAVGWPALVAGAQTAWAFIDQKILPTLRDLVSWLREKVPPAVDGVVGAFEAIKGKVGPIVESALGGDIKTALSKLGSAFADFGALAMGWLGEQVGKIEWATVWAEAKDVLASAVSWFANAATLIAGWLGDQVARINWQDVWNKAVAVFDTAVMWFGDAASKLATWIGEQVSRIDWPSVWSQAVDVVGGMATWFASLAGMLGTWIGEQAAQVDWQAVWNRAVDVVGAMASWFADLAARLTTWIGQQVAGIQWPSVWSNVTGMTAAMQTAFEAQSAALDWKAIAWANHNAAQSWADALNEQIRAQSWTTVGASLANALFGQGGSIESAMRAGWQLLRAPLVLLEPLVTFIEGVDWHAADVALAKAFVGFLNRAWDIATGGWRPHLPLPAWMVPGASGQGGMEFPVSPQPTMPGSATSGNVMRGSTDDGSRTNLNSTSYAPISNSSRDSFIRSSWPYALRAAGGNVELASYMIATAISENGDVGSGKDLGSTGFNFAGIHGQGPAGSWQGLDAGRPTTFASFNSAEEGIGGFLWFLQNNPRYAPALATYQRSGDTAQLFRDVQAAGYAEDQRWAGNVTSIATNQVLPITSSLPMPEPQGRTPLRDEIPFDWGALGLAPAASADTRAGLNPRGLQDFRQTQQQWDAMYGDANAICGPRLASLFAEAVGRPPTRDEAVALAERMGIYSSANGGSGILNASQFDEYATALLQQANPGSTARVQQQNVGGAGEASRLAQQALGEGSPLVGINTPSHYFGADQFDAASGKFHVGGTGLSLAGGSEWMSIDDIAAKGHGLISVLTLVGQQGETLAAQLAAVPQAAAAIPPALQAAAAATADTGTAAATAGQQVAQAATDVPAALAGVADAATTAGAGIQQALTSVTDLGGGLLTITQDTAGNVVATITDMAGNVTSSYQSMVDETAAAGADLLTTTQDMVSGVGDAMSELGPTIDDAVSSATDGLGNSLQNLGADLMSGLIDGIQSRAGDVADAVAGAVDDAIQAGQDEAEAQSPSQRTRRDLGQQLAAGMALGIADGAPDVRRAFSGLVAMPSLPSYGGGSGGSGGSGGAGGDGGTTIHLHAPLMGNVTVTNEADENRLAGTIVQQLISVQKRTAPGARRTLQGARR